MPRWKTATTAALGLAALAGFASAQEEIGKRRAERIRIEWASYETKSYAFQYESVIPTGTVKQVADALEEALGQYAKVFGFAPKTKFQVKFLDSLNTYEQEGGDPSHPGYFSAATGFLVLRQLPFFDLMPTAYHEALHQYLQAYVGEDVRIPLWFNEGLAVYFEGMQKDKTSKRLDHRKIDNRRMIRLKEALFTRSALPLEKLLDATPDEFHDKDKEELHYSQSFAVVYFFMQAMGGKPVFQYASELKKTKDTKAAEEKIFGKGRKNLKKIEGTWKQYVLGLKIEEKPPS
ncbi:MAG: DUF1570 domain-containing protein [Planctomycetota bacterium]